MTNKSNPIYQPTFNRVLIEMVAPSGSTILTPDGSTNPDSTIRVKAVGPDVKAFSVGDEILLIPNANVLPLVVSKGDNPLALIHDSSIVAIIK